MEVNEKEIPGEIERYAAGIDLLENVAAGLTAEQMRARPVPGKWSMLEVLCHMADFETIIAQRIKLMLCFDSPELPDVDETAYAAGLYYMERDPAQELTVFVATRRQLLPVLKQLSVTQWSRLGRHSALGTVQLFDYFKSAAGHLDHHMKHMNDKRTALGLAVVPHEESRDYPARAFQG